MSPPPTNNTAERPQLPRRRPVTRHPGIYYRPRPDGKVAPPYELCYLDSEGRRRWQVIHGSLEDAEARRAELRLRRRRGERIQPSRQTFAEHARAWLDTTDARARTKEVHHWALEQHLIPYLGRRRLDQITVDDIAAFITHMRGKNLRGWTITTALRPLSLILAQATRRGHIHTNPFTQLQRGERPKHDDQRPKRILTLDEMNALIAAADTDTFRCLIELLLSTGTRIGEALGLTIQDLDRTHNLIRVEYQLGRDGIRSPLKTTESRRAIDIPPALTRRLANLAAANGTIFKPEALIFASRNGGGLERKTVRNALTRAAKNANLNTPHPTLHDLRHSHASMLIALDVPLTDVQHRLGHRKPDTTLRIYTHQWKQHDAQRSQIGERVGDVLSGATEAESPSSSEVR